MKRYTQPFLGIFETKEGELYDIASSQIITANQIKSSMTPFYGVFVDKDNVEHNLIDYVGNSEKSNTFSSAVENGFTGTEAEFYTYLGSLGNINTVLDQIIGGDTA